MSRAAWKAGTAGSEGTQNLLNSGNAPGLPDEVFFSIITRQAIRRGSFTSVKDLIAAIEAFTDGWNDRCHPFT